MCAEHAMPQLNVRGDFFFLGVLELGQSRKSFEEINTHSWGCVLADISILKLNQRRRKKLLHCLKIWKKDQFV